MRALSTTTILLASTLCGVAASPARAAEDELAPYAKAIEENPNDAKAYDAYATKALGSNRLDDAVAKLKIGVARVDSFPNGYYLLGYSYRKKQAWADAADYYRRCVSLKWKENESYFGLGKSLAGLGDARGAALALLPSSRAISAFASSRNFCACGRFSSATYFFSAKAAPRASPRPASDLPSPK